MIEELRSREARRNRSFLRHMLSTFFKKIKCLTKDVASHCGSVGAADAWSSADYVVLKVEPVKNIHLIIYLVSSELRW